MRAFVYVIGVLLLVCSLKGSVLADLLVTSFDNSQVLRYDDVNGSFLGVFATGLSGDHPISMVVGPDGNLYVGVNNFNTWGDPSVSFVRRFNGQTGAFIDTFALGSGLDGPEDLVFGTDGNLYVSSFGGTAPNSKVIRYHGVTGAYIDDFIPVGSGGLSGAEGLVFGPDGNLYVASRVTNQILRFDGSTGAFLDVFATGGYNGPVDLTFGPDGNLYVLDPYGERAVLRFNGSTGAYIDRFVDILKPTIEAGRMAFGPDGNLYVTDYLNNSVIRFHGVTGQKIDTFISAGSGGLSTAVGLMFFASPPDLNAGLHAHYAFNEGVGDTGSDSTGNGHDGVIHGAEWETGVKSFGLRFDGVDDDVSIPVMNTNEISICAWFYKNAHDTRCIDAIFGGLRWNLDAQLREGFDVRFHPSIPDRLEFILVTQDGNGNRITKRVREVIVNAIGNWYHVVATYNKTTGEQKLYLNGKLVDGKRHAAGNAIVPLHYYSDMRIGYSRDRKGYFSGVIDDVRIYNRALSYLEVLELYNQ